MVEEATSVTESLPCPPRTRRRRRWLFGVAVCVVGAGASIALVLVCGWLHFRNTPDFATYVREHHASPDEIIDSDARWLGSGGEWSLGEGNPFAAPLNASEGGTFEVRVRHGDDLLLVLKQSFAWTVAADGKTRANFRLRTDELTTHEDFHAWARVFVHDPQRFLAPDSARAGTLTFDILLLSGAGRSEASIQDVGPSGALLPSERSFRPSVLERESEHGLTELLARTVPWSSVPDGGLVHHVRNTVYLMAEHHPGGGGSNGYGESEHSVNTAEYSYEVEVRLAERDNSSVHSWTSGSKLSWNGRVW